MKNWEFYEISSELLDIISMTRKTCHLNTKLFKLAAHFFRPEPPPNLPKPQIRSEPTLYAHIKADASEYFIYIDKEI